MTKTRRARRDAENGHRRITRSCSRILEAETQGFPTGYLRAQSGTVEYDRGSRKVSYDEAILLGGEVLWGKMRLGSFVLFHMRADPMSYVRCAEAIRGGLQRKPRRTKVVLLDAPG